MTLLGMLLPALKSAREKARQIVCIGNLKQLGSGFGMYVQDYNDCFPLWVYYDENTRWPANLIINGYAKGTLFVCPSKSSHNQWWLSGGGTGSYSKYPAYGYNYYFSYGDLLGEVPSKLSSMKNHSNIILLADTCAANAHDTGYALLRYNNSTTAGWGVLDAERHNGVVNILWVDGHVSGNKTNKINPYSESPFLNGNILGDPENHFDFR